MQVSTAKPMTTSKKHRTQKTKSAERRKNASSPWKQWCQAIQITEKDGGKPVHKRSNSGCQHEGTEHYCFKEDWKPGKKQVLLRWKIWIRAQCCRWQFKGRRKQKTINRTFFMKLQQKKRLKRLWVVLTSQVEFRLSYHKIPMLCFSEEVGWLLKVSLCTRELWTATTAGHQFYISQYWKQHFPSKCQGIGWQDYWS